MRRLSKNGDFSAWSSNPARTPVTVGTGGAGFTLADCYSGGAGPGGEFVFSTPRMPQGYAEVRDCSRYFGRWKFAKSVTHGNAGDYPGTKRSTYIEQCARHEDPEYAAGRVWTFSFDAWCDGNGTFPIVPILFWGMAFPVWAAGKPKKRGDIIQQSTPAGWMVYTAVGDGTTGANVPQHAAGRASDGGVEWECNGAARGRSYQIYEGGRTAHAGVAKVATGTPEDCAVATVTPQPQRFAVDIALPALSTMLPAQDYPDRAAVSFGFDFLNLPQAGEALNLHNIEINDGGCNRFRRSARAT